MSGENLNEYIFTWKIKNYSSCYQPKGERIKSPPFTVENIPDSEWSLWLFPKGDDEVFDDNFISVSLGWKGLSANAEATVSYVIDIVDEKHRVLTQCQSSEEEFNELCPSWGWDKFFEITELEKKLKSSEEDVVTLRCRIRKCYENQPLKLSKSTACTTIDVDQCCVKWCVKMLSQFEYSEKLAFQIRKDLNNFEITLNSTEENMQIFINYRDIEYEAPQLITFTFSIFDKTGYKFFTMRAWHMFKHEETWKFPYRIPKNLLKFCEVNSSHYEFKLMCEVNICKDNMYSSIETLEFESPCSLKIKQKAIPATAMQNHFGNFYLNETYSDVTIHCKSGNFPAHKFILRVRSPVFAAMFDQDMLENKTGVVDITDIDGKTLKAFLKYLYTETVGKMDYEMAKKLLLTADKYQVPTLVDKCVLYLKHILSTENVCEVLEIADLLNCEYLKFCALNFIKVNAAKVLTSSEWSKWIEQNIKLATHILSQLSVAIGTTGKLPYQVSHGTGQKKRRL